MKPAVRQKRKDGLKRQEQILDIALILFADKGYHNSSINDIIETADIAKGTFYLHFTGKFDLLDKIISQNIQLIYEHIKALDISRPGTVTELRDMYVNFVKILSGFKHFRHLVKLVLSENMNTEPVLMKKVNDFFDAIISLTSDYIKRAQTNGRVFASLNSQIISVCIVGSVREMLYRWAVRGEDINFKSAISSMLDLYLNGLLTVRE